MDFVWITPTYRVNIASIFSLQREIESENYEHMQWEDSYDMWITQVSKEFPTLTIDNEEYDPQNETDLDSENFKKYTQYLREKIIEKIGKEPEQYNYKYALVTHTGLKIYVSQDKFDLINKTIDNIQNKKGEA